MSADKLLCDIIMIFYGEQSPSHIFVIYFPHSVWKLLYHIYDFLYQSGSFLFKIYIFCYIFNVMRADEFQFPLSSFLTFHLSQLSLSCLMRYDLDHVIFSNITTLDEREKLAIKYYTKVFLVEKKYILWWHIGSRFQSTNTLFSGGLVVSIPSPGCPKCPSLSNILVTRILSTSYLYLTYRHLGNLWSQK